MTNKMRMAKMEDAANPLVDHTKYKEDAPNHLYDAVALCPRCQKDVKAFDKKWMHYRRNALGLHSQ